MGAEHVIFQSTLHSFRDTGATGGGSVQSTGEIQVHAATLAAEKLTALLLRTECSGDSLSLLHVV